jgi:hypothetical protein
VRPGDSATPAGPSTSQWAFRYSELSRAALRGSSTENVVLPGWMWRRKDSHWIVCSALPRKAHWVGSTNFNFPPPPGSGLRHALTHVSVYTRRIPVNQLQLLLGDCGESMNLQRGKELMMYHRDHEALMASIIKSVPANPHASAPPYHS